MNTHTNLLRWLYTIILSLCIPLLYLRLLWRSRKNPLYRKRWLERLGIFTPPSQTGGVWIHAVSVGESIAAVGIIRAFMKQFPHIPITVTTGTPNGSNRIQQMLGKDVFHVYFPFDLPWAISQFLKRVQPKICVLMETELWPNCLTTLKKSKIPVIVVNARLSPRSLQGYQRIREVMREMMSCITLVAAQSAQDGDRFLSLGLPKARLQVTGNVKFDIAQPQGIADQANLLKTQWGEKRPVWIAASTHAGEEAMVLDAHQRIREKFPQSLLILVPRHPERRDEVIQTIKQHNFSFVLRSSQEPCHPETAVFLIDTMGEMPLFYEACDVAFVGGSLVPVGGHNTLEPALASRPVVVGPHVHNFTEITAFLLKAGALLQIDNSAALANTVIHWLCSEADRVSAGQRGRQVVDDNRGAVDKVVKLVHTVML